MQQTEPVTRVTRYRNMLLTPRHRGDPFNPHSNGSGYGINKRTRKVFDYIGECIASGGRVDMETWYDGPEIRADIRLEWGNDSGSN